MFISRIVLIHFVRGCALAFITIQRGVQMRLRTQSLGVAAILTAAIWTGMPSASAAQQPNQKDPKRSDIDVITVTGCVEKEADYRNSISSGKGGALGSGVGVGNEYVLRSVQTVKADTLKPTGTSPQNYEEVYAVTGDLEHELDKALGHKVAASGYVEVAKSKGTDKVKDLPNFKVVGWHSVADTCSPAVTKG